MASPPAESPSNVSSISTARGALSMQTEATGSVKPDRACENCRRVKRKCTLEKPSCSNCRNHKLECVYSGRRRKPGPQKGAKSRRRCALLSRIANLESMISSNNSPLTRAQVRHRGGKFGAETIVPDVVASDSSSVMEGTPGLPSFFPNPTMPYMDRTNPMFPGSSDCNLTIPIEKWTINQADWDQLFSLYFSHIQPMFPLFRQAVFYHDIICGRIPTELLAIMLALAARFSPNRMLAQHTDYRHWHAILSQSEPRCETQTSTRPGTIDLNAAKKECLLAVYEYIQFPGHEAWSQAGRMTRTAIGCGIHQIDSPKVKCDMTEEEREECRFVWWTIYKLDTCFNGIALTQLGINDNLICTFLPSTSIEDFTADLLRPSSKKCLQTGPRGFEQVLRREGPDQDVDCERLYIRLTALLRESHVLRSLLGLKYRAEHRDELSNIASVCRFIQSSLPGWFHSPARRIEPQEAPHQHRRRLEMLLQFNVLRLQSELPIFQMNEDDPEELDIQRWQNCVGYAEDISSIFKHWDESYYEVVNPITSYLIWYAGTVLLIQAMSIPLELATAEAETRRLETAANVIYTSLCRFSTWWPVASKLTESIDELRLWMWLQLSWPEVKTLVDQLHVLLDPKDHGCMNIHVHILEPPGSRS